MKIDKELLLKSFEKKSFLEKKKELLNIIRELAGINDIVDQLGEMIYNLSKDIEDGLYLEIYELLIDTSLSLENENNQKAINNLGKIKEILKETIKKEELERKEENALLDNLFNDL